ncbi:MAG: DUF4126 domain-containing protein [Acidobacteriota bacterium]
MDWASGLLAAGTASASGLNLYATVLTLGLCQRQGWIELPSQWQVLGEFWVLAVAGVLFLVEFVVDKIPYADNLWDAVHTFIRVPAGAVLMATAFAEVDPSLRVVAGLLGGGLALTTHGAKSSARLAVNTSPEPFSNILLSLAEDGITIALLALAASHPWMAAAVLGMVLAVSLLLLYLFFRFTRALFSRLRSWVGRSGRKSVPAA